MEQAIHSNYKVIKESKENNSVFMTKQSEPLLSPNKYAIVNNENLIDDSNVVDYDSPDRVIKIRKIEKES